LATIRRAVPVEAKILTELTLRSKAYWGYDDIFVAAVQQNLTITPDYVEANPVFVLEEGAQVQGFYSLKASAATDEVELDFLFIEPAGIGTGYGKQLWQHAVCTGRQTGFHTMLIEAEPQAEEFYKKMGAVRVATKPSPLAHIFPGRVLPVLRFDLTLAGDDWLVKVQGCA